MRPSSALSLKNTLTEAQQKIYDQLPRIAFTIVYQGLHHLKHNGFFEFMTRRFDHWVVVEGLARNGGSTWWCNNLPLPARSTDGTHEFFQSFKSDNLSYYSKGSYYLSKDEMVQTAIETVQRLYQECLLWQVDVDEQWDEQDMADAERLLIANCSMCGSFRFNHYVGRVGESLMICRGAWGDGYNNRLWHWKGQQFESHEPARLHGQGGALPLPQRIDHYSYYFEQDVQFKSQYYKGYERVHAAWQALQKKPAQEFPCHISYLFGRRHHNSRSTTRIHLHRMQGS